MAETNLKKKNIFFEFITTRSVDDKLLPQLLGEILKQFALENLSFSNQSLLRKILAKQLFSRERSF